MKNFFRFLHRDEDGTALTEFVITLPIFVMVFAGITSIGSVNEKSTRTWIRAYKETFDAAIDVQHATVDAHMLSVSGAVYGAAHIATVPKNMGAVQRTMFTVSDGAAFIGLGTKGTLGEQHGRLLLTDPFYDLNARQGSRSNNDKIEGVENMFGNGNSDSTTKDIDDIVGESGYAEDIFDDSANFSGSGGSGALGALNSLLSGLGARPTLATGTRYGTVLGTSSDTITVGAFTYSPSAFLVTLVAPTPVTHMYGGDVGAELVVTAATRLAMEDTDAYSELLGIDTDQPLDSSSIDVPCFANANFWNDC